MKLSKIVKFFKKHHDVAQKLDLCELCGKELGSHYVSLQMWAKINDLDESEVLKVCLNCIGAIIPWVLWKKAAANDDIQYFRTRIRVDVFIRDGDKYMKGAKRG